MDGRTGHMVDVKQEWWLLKQNKTKQKKTNSPLKETDDPLLHFWLQAGNW